MREIFESELICSSSLSGSMVISGVSEGVEPLKFKMMDPERSKRLHNFSMPCLKWGNQRLLRCKQMNSNAEISSFDRKYSASEPESEVLISRRREFQSEKHRTSTRSESLKKSSLPPIGASGRKSRVEMHGDDEIEAIREKLMFDLRTTVDKMKVAIVDEEEESPAAAARPWNLRTRRAACKAPDETRGEGRSSRNLDVRNFRSKGLAAVQGVEKKEQRKFSISLSREEVEEDFLSMIGTRPSRRPKKRAKIVQKNLDSVFPGLWLSEITPDSYKVPDLPESGKS